MLRQIYAVANQKGGVGKTTTVANLAGHFASCGRRVLAVDLDPQGGLTTSLDVKERGRMSTYDCLSTDDASLESCIVQTSIPRLDIVPADIDDLSNAEGALMRDPGWQFLLRGALAPVHAQYDIILVDCPPTLGVLTINALHAGSVALVPVACEYLALKGLDQIRRIIAKVRRNHQDDLTTRIVRTLYDGRTRHDREASAAIAERFADETFATHIRATIQFADSTSLGVPLTVVAPKSTGATDYRALADELTAAFAPHLADDRVGRPDSESHEATASVP